MIVFVGITVLITVIKPTLGWVLGGYVVLFVLTELWASGWNVLLGKDEMDYSTRQTINYLALPVLTPVLILNSIIAWGGSL